MPVHRDKASEMQIVLDTAELYRNAWYYIQACTNVLFGIVL